jgi:hypothetical protein
LLFIGSFGPVYSEWRPSEAPHGLSQRGNIEYLGKIENKIETT